MHINGQNLGVAVGFGSSSSINISDETLLYKLLQLSHALLIKDGALIFCHVTRKEEAPQDLVRLIVNRHFRFSYGSSTPGHYNSSDEQPRFIHLIKHIVVHLDAITSPLHLSENEGLRLNDLYSID